MILADRSVSIYCSVLRGNSIHTSIVLITHRTCKVNIIIWYTEKSERGDTLKVENLIICNWIPRWSAYSSVILGGIVLIIIYFSIKFFSCKIGTSHSTRPLSSLSFVVCKLLSELYIYSYKYISIIVRTALVYPKYFLVVVIIANTRYQFQPLLI